MDRELKPATRHRRIFKGWLRAVLVAAVALFALVWLTGMLKPTLKHHRIRTSTVERGTFEAVITASGVLQPATEQVLSSPIDARVIRVLHQPGTYLEAGQAILELDVSRSRLELASLDERIEQAENRRRERELELQESLIDLSSRQELRGLDVEELTYQVQQNRELFDQGLISEAVLRQVETQLKKARIEQRTLGDSMGNARRTAEAQLARLDSEIRALRREQDEARRQLDLATTQAERSGVLTWVVDEEGATIRTGDVLARLADLDSFRVEATVSDIHASRLAPNQPVYISVGEARLDGRIARVLPAMESGTARFWVHLEEPGHDRLRSNLRVDVLVVTERKDAALIVRKGPYVSGTGPQEVFVMRGVKAERRQARLGLSGYEHYEVLDGLAEGDEVVVSDVSHVIHLDEVEIR